MPLEEARERIEANDWSSTITAEMLQLLDEQEDDLVALRESFDETRTREHVNEMKHRFPIFNDHVTELDRFDDYPRLVECLLLALYIDYRMPQFREELLERVAALRHHLEGDSSDAGGEVFRFLTGDGARGLPRQEMREQLVDAVSDAEQELADYDLESEAYADRDIDEEGLLTRDAVKCLEDFEGRTFPFLRAICARIGDGMDVLEVGVGTGVLSFAAALKGADEVVGIEINPVTCVLADTIRDHLVRHGVIDEDAVDICWGDALNFGTIEYESYGERTFDALISENIYTGMFHELQMKMISRAMESDLIPYHTELVHGFHHRVTDVPVIPEGMATCAELVQLTEHDIMGPTAVLFDLQERGIDIEQRLAEDHPYDQIDFRVDEIPNIRSLIKFHIVDDGRVDAVNVYSTIRMMAGDYIDRNENTFLNNDSLLFLNEPMQVEQEDLVIAGLAYNGSDDVENIIMELRKLNDDGSVDEAYDARLNIPERQHRENKLRFKQVNNLKEPLNLSHMGDFEVVRSSSYFDGYAHLWMSDIDYVNKHRYGV